MPLCWQALGIGYLVAALTLAVGCVQAQADADYNYPVLWNTKTIAATNVDYADGSTKLRVPLPLLACS